MFLHRMKISHKILAVILVGLLPFSAYTVLTRVIPKRRITVLEEIYTSQVNPLDNLRQMQLIFRELEYGMIGVIAYIVAAVGPENASSAPRRSSLFLGISKGG